MKTGRTKNRKGLLNRLFGRGTGLKRTGRFSQQSGRLKLQLLNEKESQDSVKSGELKDGVHSRSKLESFAYEHISKFLPAVPRYREAFDQAGLSIIFESYMSTAILLSALAVIPAVALSLLVFVLMRAAIFETAAGSIIIGLSSFIVSLFVWVMYPLQRRRALRAKLESQLPYSFGILGVLSAAGINIERMFERIAASDPNPMLASLARRFIRNIKIFGLDTESALREVAMHSPSPSFAKMLESLAVAYRTTGSVNDLIMFESTRLLSEKSDRLKKKIGDLAVMAELYITLVVVGPIIFIVMLSILQLLPYSGSLPSIPLINALVFVGIPVISVGFTLMLDSTVSRI